MVSRQISLHKLVSVNFNVDWNLEDNILKLIFYVDKDNKDNYTGILGDKEYHLVPDKATINRLKAVRDQIRNQLQNTILVEGTIQEAYEVQEVTYPSSIKTELVKVQ